MQTYLSRITLLVSLCNFHTVQPLQIILSIAAKKREMILSKSKGQTVRFEQTVRFPDLVLETLFFEGVVLDWELAPFSALAYCTSQLTNGVKPKPVAKKVNRVNCAGTRGRSFSPASSKGRLTSAWPEQATLA
jgi:hypothetical protein